MSKHYMMGTGHPRRHALAAALAISLGFTGVAMAQSTTGSFFGQAPVGDSVTVVSQTGISRDVPVDSTGRYRVGNLPVGSYTVQLKKDGAIVDTRNDVTLNVGVGTEVSFAAKVLNTVTVSANSIPKIDVTSVDSRSVITSKDLERLPLGRTAEAIALLAPGVVQGSGFFNNSLSFGGGSPSENAYYINGFSSSDPLSNLGGVGLPYGSIDQQETYIGGYSAKYGRSDGGVINQIGKQGTNEWHFGGQVLWEPRFAESDPVSRYYPNMSLPSGYTYAQSNLPGTIYQARQNDKQWRTVYDAYVGGPLIKDKLFFFLAAESEKVEGRSTNTSDASQAAYLDYTNKLQKFYGKINWNITDNNLLEFTHIVNKQPGDAGNIDPTGNPAISPEVSSGEYYGYNYATGKTGGALGLYPIWSKNSTTLDIIKYTGYITQDLTVSATFGKNDVTNFTEIPGQNATDPFIANPLNQNPAYTGGGTITNSNTVRLINSPDAKTRTHGLRLDVDYHLGSHDLSVGMDNMFYHASDQGQVTSGPGYAWYYFITQTPNDPINSYSAAPGSPYYARQRIFHDATSMSVAQKAYYLEDKWQATDRWMIDVGLRNDRFTNLNNAEQPYVRSGNQWAPRLGTSWDVFGDSSLKVYANLGRYYLALPSSVAIRGASASTYTDQYFTYSGIAANGAPTGLTALGPAHSADNEYGVTPDPKTFTATNLRSEYQDELILGFDKTLGSAWTTGAKFTLRRLESAIDDVCDTDKIATKLTSMGLVAADYITDQPGCRLINPGKSNDFLVARTDGTGYTKVTMTKDDWGFTEGAKRKYYALNMYLEHPFDGKWQARLDYTFSRSYGNTEGQVRSDIGQTDVSKTEDWDFAALMANANGVLFNDRTHQIKAYGVYAITSEWMVSGRLVATSGAPKSCLGYYPPPDTDPSGYLAAYHYCFAQPSSPGAVGRMPWNMRLDMGVMYRPMFAQQKLAFGLDVFNVLNRQVPTQWSATSESSSPGTVLNTYGLGMYYTQPRYVRLSVSYDY
ncbi:TonB-dependent receptor [Dyella sp.]|jgi:outer membrane receptor for ferrienterochelin and colicin|uniref:TonB-dependent receptor n=1 Tax=Dyella sp. TaxID=1869338 RepID=UPI002FDB84C1